jgi:hypothetical protein
VGVPVSLSRSVSSGRGRDWEGEIWKEEAGVPPAGWSSSQSHLARIDGDVLAGGGRYMERCGVGCRLKICVGECGWGRLSRCLQQARWEVDKRSAALIEGMEPVSKDNK